MRKAIIIPIVIGSVLLTLGGVALGLGLYAHKNNSKTVTNTYDLNGNFADIDISLQTADLSFVATTDGTAKVVCVETEKVYHVVKEEDGKLNITYVDATKWFERIFNFGFDKRSVTIYLPTYSFENLKVRSSTGDITIPNDFGFANLDIELSTGDSIIKSNVSGDFKIHASTGNVTVSGIAPQTMEVVVSTGKINLASVDVTNKLYVKSSTGNIKLDTATADELEVYSSTGNVSLIKTVITNKMYIKTSTGNVRFEDSDAGTIEVHTSTGDVKGTLLTSKSFDASSGTGHVNVPKHTTGGECTITTSTGDIEITIKE